MADTTPTDTVCAPVQRLQSAHQSTNMDERSTKKKAYEVSVHRACTKTIRFDAKPHLPINQLPKVADRMPYLIKIKEEFRIEVVEDLSKTDQSIFNEGDKKGSTAIHIAAGGTSTRVFCKELETWKKENWVIKRTAKEALLEKLKVMGQLLERNDVLENSLSDLGAELEGVRGKLKSLEESYQSLSDNVRGRFE
ncbi:kinase interacting (KIP1-like) family protein [Artemisia annua]|uniref:Kinase interacting (KIP1-like) family protein n=1 Tax=Artemisia annua TaxID=35608 RepID=A0A2U1MGG6_ARTAN|nr:kinase interacting (KIP1-like) family protein [Artemisia annua]